MDIRRCFEILELERNASLDEARQAYKDVVNVWHPDRFSNNPRLKRKAEEKLKEINAAFEAVKSHLSSTKEVEPGPAETFEEGAGAETGDKTETAFEVGTEIFLNICSSLYTTFRRFVEEQSNRVEDTNDTRSGESNRRPGQRKAFGGGRAGPSAGLRAGGRGMARGAGARRKGGSGKRGG